MLFILILTIFSTISYGNFHDHDHTKEFIDISHGCNSGYIAIRGTDTCVRNPCPSCDYGVFSTKECKFRSHGHRHKRRMRTGAFHDKNERHAMKICKQVRYQIEEKNLYNNPEGLTELRDLHGVKYLQKF